MAIARQAKDVLPGAGQTGAKQAEPAQKRAITRRLTGWPAVAVLLAAHYAIGFGASWNKSLTFDELAHITGGYTYWKLGDYRLDAEGGMLGQRLMGLPLIWGNYNFIDLNEKYWRLSEQWVVGQWFFFERGNDPQRIMRLSRSVMHLVSVALGLVVYLWSRKLFGPVGAMISLVLYAFNPAFLANGPLGTMDVLTSLTFMLSLGAFWMMLHKVNPLTVGLSGLALAALALTKMSWPVVAPMMLILLVVRLGTALELPVWLGRFRYVRGRLRQFGVIVVACVLMGAIVVMMIWGAYGFRYSPYASYTEGVDTLKVEKEMELNGPVARTVEFARQHRLLPQAYLSGLSFTYAWSQARAAFLNGEYSLTGWWWFFPFTFAVKTPLGFFVILALGAAVMISRLRKESATSATDMPAWTKLIYRTAPLWSLLMVYAGIALTSKINIGHRHILPIYPPLFVLAGAAWACWSWRSSFARVLLVGGVLLATAESLSAWPNYMAYFNPVCGGSSKAYRHLVDSSLDWGQDLPGLKRYLQRYWTGSEYRPKVYLAYFGTGSPTWHGIKAYRLPGFFDNDAPTKYLLELQGGIYCISATMLQGVYTAEEGKWTRQFEKDYEQVLTTARGFFIATPEQQEQMTSQKGKEYWDKLFAALRGMQFARLCAYLRGFEPDDNIGHSILIYRLSDQQVDRALYGPADGLITD